MVVPITKGGKVVKGARKNNKNISYVVIPLDILQNKSLNPSEKILFCYLNFFYDGVCFQSNEKIAKMTGLTVSTIKRGLKKLEKERYIYVEFVNNNSAKRKIYTVMDNPDKLAYLARKGMFDINRK